MDKLQMHTGLQLRQDYSSMVYQIVVINANLKKNEEEFSNEVELIK